MKKVALVTGSSRGIGRAVAAEQLEKAGNRRQQQGEPSPHVSGTSFCVSGAPLAAARGNVTVKRVPCGSTPSTVTVPP